MKRNNWGPISNRWRRVVGAFLGMGAAAAMAGGLGAVASPAAAASGNSGSASSGPNTFGSFVTGASAPVAQITEDFPTATFHPQGEAEYNYTLATLDPTRGYGLATTVWPGGAAANAGALVVLLGGPSQAGAVSDPVRAEADSGSTQSQTVTAPNGTVMSAKATQQASSAQGQTAGGSFGPAGSMGSSTSSSAVTLDPSGTKLTSTAQTDASNISVAGVINIGSITSSALAVSVNAAKPTASGTTNVSNVTVAGQPAYIDGSGVHAGKPGQPGPPGAQTAINTALQAFGMTVTVTSPQTYPIGGVVYYVAGSLTFFWQVPHDPNGDSFTESFGGSAVSMGVTAAPPSTTPVTTPTVPSTPAPVGNSGALEAALGPPPSNTPIALPPSSNGATISTGVGRGRSIRAVNAALPTGVGGFWAWIFIGGLIGAIGLPLVPGIFDKTAAAVCPRERRP